MLKSKPKRRRFRIDVTIDTSTKAKRAGSHMFLKKTGHYKVNIARSRDKEDTLFASLLHELGHVIGEEMSLRRTMLDPRGPRGHLKEAETVLASEQEAWEVADELSRFVAVSRKPSEASYREIVTRLKKNVQRLASQ